MDLGGEEFFFRTTDGLRLSGRDYGPRRSDRCPVICLAGLTRNVRDFDALARYLAEEAPEPRRVISLDSRGRGQSDHARPQTYQPAAEAADVLAGMIARGVHDAGFVGTSRGGLLCMAIGTLRPGVLKAVVLNDIGPVIHVRYLAGLKDYISGRATPATWEDAESSLKQGFSSTFSAMTDADWARMARQLYDDKGGRPSLSFDTRLAETLAEVHADSPPVQIWPYFNSLRGIPLLSLRGENSPLFGQETLHAMMRRSPKLEAFVTPDEGHAPLLWDRASQDRIRRFLDFHAPA